MPDQMGTTCFEVSACSVDLLGRGIKCSIGTSTASIEQAQGL